MNSNPNATVVKDLPKKPHKHAEIIKAWADGATIEYRHTLSDGWNLDPNTAPHWHEKTEYRVKPDPTASVYPETSLTDDEIVQQVYQGGTRGVMNYAIRRAIDDGQVVVPGSVVNAELDPDFQEVGAAKIKDDVRDLLDRQAESVYNLATRSCRAMAEYLGKSREDVSFEVVQAIVLLETGRMK